MPRVLVIVPNDSYRAADFVAAADALSIDLSIASEERPPLRPDDGFVRIDCGDPVASAEAVADLAARTPVDAIVAADDAGVEIAARASQLLGLTASPPAAAAVTLDKLAARRLLASGEVPQPEFLVLAADDDPAAVVAGFGGPVVIKPPMLSAGRGVLRVDEPGDAAPTVERIRRIVAAAGRDPDGPLLVERYVDGPEVSVEGIVWEGEVEVLAILDKPIPMTGPAFEETIFVTPSRHDGSVLAEVERVTASAVRALGLTEGPIHAELRIERGRPLVIEIAGRTIGGLCGRALRFGLLGAPLETMVLRHALGLRKTSLRRETDASGVLMIPIPRAGVLRAVTGVDETRALPGVTSVEITAPVGSWVAPPPEGDRYLGFVFARRRRPDEVEEILRTAMESIRVVVD
ncbi:MAG TPA: ATP-grasp domain-containing protein [Acidimicrobiia bacterium]|nr:ATP-grasp domain-containing protein [Acidimicrobiia bacterium]